MEYQDLVNKWLQNELSETEVQGFNAMNDADLHHEIIQEAQRFKGSQNAKVLPFNTFETFLAVKEQKTSMRWMRIISTIAAIFVVGLAIVTFFNKNTTLTFETQYAENKSITLPDNSFVKLNQLSKLDYNTTEWDENRILNLDGEAFFDVATGKRFDVVTPYGTVSVLGTEFNVTARDTLFKVSCYEGLVQVNHGNESTKVPAGTEFVLQSKNIQLHKIAVAEPQWLKGMSVFKNAALPDVLLEIEKQYHVNVSYESHDNKQFTGAFEHNNLQNALKSVTQPLHLSFAIQENGTIVITNAKI